MYEKIRRRKFKLSKLNVERKKVIKLIILLILVLIIACIFILNKDIKNIIGGKTLGKKEASTIETKIDYKVLSTTRR